MNRMARYSAVNTKIRVMESRLLKNDDFKNLLNKKSVAEIASYLKYETHYRDALSEADEKTIHRRQLELLIKKDHAAQIGKVAHYFYDDYREFFKYVFIKREIAELKSMLRSISNDEGETTDSDSFAHIGLLTKVKPDVLLSSANLGDFIKNLRGSIYYKYLQPIEDMDDEKRLFIGEMALDLAYFDIFYSSTSDLDSKDRKITEQLQGINVDLLNIQSIYRGIKYYNISREILFNYTIHHGLEFNIRDIKDLCYAKDIDEFQKKIMKTRYRFLFENENTKDMFMERRLMRHQFFNVVNIERKHELNISTALAFDVLLEYEIRDIITVIESVRYDMAFGEASKFLIRKL